MRTFASLTTLASLMLLSDLAAANPIVIDLKPGSSSDNLQSLIAGPTDAFLTTSDNLGNARLYRSNGTAAGTALLDTYGPSSTNAANVALYAATSKGLFFVYQGSLQLHNTGSGAVVLGAVPSATGGFLGEFANGTAIFGFSKDAGVTTLPLFKSDGTPGGTGTISGATYDGLKPDAVAILGNAAFYIGGLGSIGRTDGTAVTTFYTAQGSPTKYARGVASCNGKLYAVLGSSAGEGLYVSDGTAAPSLLHESASFSAAWFHCAGTKTFFLGKEAATGGEIWVSDGTVPGTHITKDVNLGPGNAINGNLVSSMRSVVDGRIYFRADDGSAGDEPWTSDGSASGTVMLADVTAGPTSSFCNWLSPRGQGTKAFCRSGAKVFEANGTTLTERTSAFTNVSAPNAVTTTGGLGTKLLYKGGASQPSTGSELAVIDTTQALIAGDGGVVVPPTGDAGPKSDAGAGSDASSQSDAAVGVDGGEPSGSDGGSETDDGGTGGANAVDSTEEASGCSVATSPTRDDSSYGLGLGLLGIAAAFGARRRYTRHSPPSKTS